MLRRIVSACLFLCLIAQISWASPWPTIPETDRELKSVAGFEDASAVVLLREGRVHLDATSRSSYIEVYTRKKILHEEGLQYATIVLRPPEFSRTKDIEVRAHLPDGRIIEMPKSASFENQKSEYYGVEVLSYSFPGVVKGTILEYRYRSYFDSVFFPQVWCFQSMLPTILSRVTYEIPQTITFKPFVQGIRPDVHIEEEVSENVEGVRVSYTATSLDPVPDEGARRPFVDLATRLTFLPILRHRKGPNEPLFSSWENTVDVVWGDTRRGYQKFFTGASASRRMAKKIAAQATTPREKAQAIFRWVRDDVETVPYQTGWLNSWEKVGIHSHGGVWVGEQESDQVLRKGKADIAEKSLLLKVMLEGAKLKPRLAWVNPRDRGEVDREIPNPNQFSRVLVALDLDGETIFLDPSDRKLAFGRLHPELQGVQCLVFTKKSQQWGKTPNLLLPLQPTLIATLSQGSPPMTTAKISPFDDP